MAKVCRNSRTGLFQSCARKGGKPVRKSGGMRGLISQCAQKGKCGPGKSGAYVSTPARASAGATALKTGCYYYVGKGAKRVMKIKATCLPKIRALNAEAGISGLRGRGPCRTKTGKFKKCPR